MIDDCVSMLTALDLRNSGLIPNGLTITNWTKYLTHENLYQDKWLFSYEAIKQGWMTTRTNYISADPFFSILDNPNLQVRECIGPGHQIQDEYYARHPDRYLVDYGY